MFRILPVIDANRQTHGFVSAGDLPKTNFMLELLSVFRIFSSVQKFEGARNCRKVNWDGIGATLFPFSLDRYPVLPKVHVAQVGRRQQNYSHIPLEKICKKSLW